MNRSERLRGMVAMAVMVGGLSVVGCAEPPAPVPQKDIRGHADQFNEKMKQEEAERGQPPHGTMR